MTDTVHELSVMDRLYLSPFKERYLQAKRHLRHLQSLERQRPGTEHWHEYRKATIWRDSTDRALTQAESRLLHRHR